MKRILAASFTIFAVGKNGGDGATFQQPFLSVIFYAQRIKKFVGAIPHLIERYKTAKKVL
jgi:hypothetical protein